jgi:hypothetical protein
MLLLLDVAKSLFYSHKKLTSNSVFFSAVMLSNLFLYGKQVHKKGDLMVHQHPFVVQNFFKRIYNLSHSQVGFVGSAFQCRDIVMRPGTGQRRLSLNSRVTWSPLQKHFYLN